MFNSFVEAALLWNYRGGREGGGRGLFDPPGPSVEVQDTRVSTELV